MVSFIIGLVAIICFYLLVSSKKTPKTVIWIVYSAIFAVTISFFIYKIVYTAIHPEFWDFTSFYLFGKVAVGGNNFYLPENFHVVFDSLKLPAILNIPNATRAGFISGSVNVGFPYPPPTILYFVPLGYLSYQTALIIWTSFISIFSFACIYLAYSMFFKEYKLKGLMLVAILFFTLPQARGTVFYTQTNFILFFLLLLMKKYSDNKIAGIFLALAFVTKPYMLIFVLYFIIRKRWNSILYFFLTSVALMGLTLAFFGKAPFLSYIFNNPANRIPKSSFLESINQSLNSVLLRANLIAFNHPATYMFISIAIIILTGSFLLYISKKKLYDNMWDILLLIGLIIYPGTLSHYGVLLLFIIYQFFDKSSSIRFNAYLTISIIALFYFLISFSLFFSICFLLAIIIYKSFKSTNPSKIEVIGFNKI